MEMTPQEDKESLVEFLTGWRGKATKMTNKPTEKEQVRMVVKNLQPQFRKYLITQLLATFEQVFDPAIEVEDALQSGDIERRESSQRDTRRPYTKGQTLYHWVESFFT
ncbi:hypothetical protein U1Q18_052441 [Sarracenia purpurea var. burkii]